MQTHVSLIFSSKYLAITKTYLLTWHFKNVLQLRLFVYYYNTFIIFITLSMIIPMSQARTFYSHCARVRICVPRIRRVNHIYTYDFWACFRHGRPSLFLVKCLEFIQICIAKFYEEITMRLSYEPWSACVGHRNRLELNCGRRPSLRTSPSSDL